MPVTYQDLVTPKLRALLTQLSPAQRVSMLQRLAREVEVRLKRHFSAREAEGNRHNFPRTHWWAREVAAKTGVREVTPDSAKVGVASPQFAFKLRGGTIRPKGGRKLLAIPLRGEAYGVLPRANTIPGLFFIKLRTGGRMYLATREGDALRVYWRLVPRATIPPDPRALPPAADLQRALEARFDKELARVRAQYPGSP